jgi:HK97 family phage prohead protease
MSGARDGGIRAVRRSTATGAVKFIGVGERQIRVIASDATPDRMGDVLDPYGCDLENYRRNPIVLAQHDANQPVARCSNIKVQDGAVMALIDFPPAGVSARSDEYLALAKSGVVSAVSVGFLPQERKPITGGGYCFTKWEMLELSLVSVPANPSALVTERSFTGSSTRAADLIRLRSLLGRVDAALGRGGPQAKAKAPSLTNEEFEQLSFDARMQEQVETARARERQRAGAAVALRFLQW